MDATAEQELNAMFLGATILGFGGVPPFSADHPLGSNGENPVLAVGRVNNAGYVVSAIEDGVVTFLRFYSGEDATLLWQKNIEGAEGMLR